MSPVSKAQQKATAKYENANYDKFLVRVPKGKKPEIQAAADKQGESLNAYVIGAVEQRMQSEQENKE